ncbi:HNH endonuclease [Streptomyces sp. RB6PN25]|uniref:HNH endonuclease n=2 Tax=Streptomyces humicola TaxID=2953240 RepID=A0ABT1PZ23_9ACTN|nr:HNH endonuclease [Streptomyces humicola]
MDNLSVQQLHTYYVLAGATPVLVHNDACTLRPGFEPTEGRGGAPGSRAGKNFTPAGKDEVIQRNAYDQPDGIARCANPECSVELQVPVKSQRGVTPDPREAQVDHQDPRSLGGSGDPSNGQALCRVCNRQKSDGPQLW